MAKIGFKQYSVKVKAPWWILYHYPDSLKEVFEDKLRGFISREFRVTVRVYRHAVKCRFTVIFKENWKDPDVVNELLDKVAKRTVLAVTTDKLNKK